MQYRRLFFACLFFCSLPAFAQSCEGGLYLNPQVIRGEGASQTESALRELVDFMRPTGLSVTPVVNVKEIGEVLATKTVVRVVAVLRDTEFFRHLAAHRQTRFANCY